MPNRFFKTALLVSTLLHLLAFVGLGVLNEWHFLELVPRDIAEAADQRQEPPLEFELVESPENVPVEQPDEAHLVSDKSARAHNPEAPDNLALGEPFSRGLMNFKELPMEEPRPQAQDLAGQDGGSQNRPDPSDRRVEDQGRQSAEVRPAREFTREYLTGEPSRPVVRQEIQRPPYRQESTRAPQIGGFSFSTYAWDFAPYLLSLRRKIQRNIFPPPAFTQMGIISGETLVRFRIYPNGEVSDVEVLDYRGHRSLMVTSVNAVKFAAPFRPLPDDFPEEYLEVTGTFSYIVMR